ncbi:methyltransferase [Pullulanibacillus camelliae]|uniref:Methyltransferase n=1 Tax=Pullulanibacillus camelliae TaxID=1707096 RepID=A0A8J2VGF7_9BACL|nr:class I SAM-dependent rRNA methyltransferase [Pullulanibacillus camelliae]GGE29482.1 methyltransferase [Pullulanibacillus camelliae]
MEQDIQLQVKPGFIKKYQNGFPLIEKAALVNPDVLKKEGVIVHLVDTHRAFLAKGYYGRQNKGYGWVLSQKQSETIDAAFFARKIQKALQLRQQFYHHPETTAFRVFNGEGDGIGGLTIDYFDGFYLLQWYSEGIYTFKEAVIQALKNAVDYRGIYEKKRFDSKGKYIDDDDFVTGERGEFPIVVKENGVKLAVHLNEGAMVGVFLDQRNVRQRIMTHYAKGKTVLNMFSYTGAFSIFAACGGALKTTSVDVANRSRPKTTENFHLNGIDEAQHDIIVEDVFQYFKYARKKQLSFDMVVVDPPSFAKTKKHTFSVGKDYKDLMKDTIALTKPDGTIVASTNYSALSMQKFKGIIAQAFRELNLNYQLLEVHTVPEDFRTIASFPEGNYLKVLFIKKLDK